MKKPVCIFTFIIASLLSFSLQAETESGEWFQTGANQNSIKFFKSGVDEKTLKQAVLDTVKRYAQTIACNRGDGYRSVLSSKDGDNYFLFGIRPYKGEEYLWSYDKDKSPLYGVIWSGHTGCKMTAIGSMYARDMEYYLTIVHFGPELDFQDSQGNYIFATRPVIDLDLSGSIVGDGCENEMGYNANCTVFYGAKMISANSSTVIISGLEDNDSYGKPPRKITLTLKKNRENGDWDATRVYKK